MNNLQLVPSSNRFKRKDIFHLTVLFVLLLISGCSLSAVLDSEQNAKQALGWSTYRGAWFEIAYPHPFTPVPSLPSNSGEGYDSVEFISPDGSVSFYVYSPQWGGEPTDVSLDPEREIIVKEKLQEQYGRITHWLTICKKDYSSCRTLRDIIANQGSVRTTLGIKYRDEKERHRYQEDYQTFQQSLQQFAD